MLTNTNFDDLSKRLSAAVPPGLSAVGADLDKTFHAILQGAFEKMNLVSREEFEAQKAVLPYPKKAGRTGGEGGRTGTTDSSPLIPQDGRIP